MALDASRWLAATALLALSACSAITPYPDAWSPLVKTDDCSAVTGKYGNVAAGVFPPEAQSPTLTEVFSALEQGIADLERRFGLSSWRGGALLPLAEVTSVELQADRDRLIARFVSPKPEVVSLVFSAYRREVIAYIPVGYGHYLCPGGLSPLITFLAQPAGAPFNATTRPAETRVSLLPATDGSLVVRWATASSALGGYDRAVWLRYPPRID